MELHCLLFKIHFFRIARPLATAHRSVHVQSVFKNSSVTSLLPENKQTKKQNLLLALTFSPEILTSAGFVAVNFQPTMNISIEKTERQFCFSWREVCHSVYAVMG